MDKEEKSQLSTEALSAKIATIMQKIKTDSDTNPAELEQIKTIIRKNVPFFMRGAFSAYILRELLSKDGPRREKKERRKEDFERIVKNINVPRTEKKEAVQAAASVETPAEKSEEGKEERAIPEGAKTLYLNIGKMKRLYAKNLSQILQSELGITREDIYSLRVHDKYSFITMSEENCEKAISLLNGKEINGRVAMINYSNR